MITGMTVDSWGVPAAGRAYSPVTSDATDPADLLRRSGRGDELAFAELYDQSCHRLFGLVLRVMGDPVRAQEVTRSVYLHVWRHSARFDPARGGALGWMMTTAHQAAVEAVAAPRLVGRDAPTGP